jgi:DNA-binding NtrC family response regulator
MANQRMVLVVYADPQDRLGAALLLEAAGYRVLSANNFDEAKHMLATEAPDMLVTDLRLGPYNGLHLVLRSRTDHPDMATLVTSRVADPVLEAEALRQSAGFLLLPVSDDEFLDAVANSLETASRVTSTSSPRNGASDAAPFLGDVRRSLLN